MRTIILMLLTTLLIFTGCVDEQYELQISANLAPDPTECTITAGSSTKVFLTMGSYNLYVRDNYTKDTTYLIHPEITNRLKSNVVDNFETNTINITKTNLKTYIVIGDSVSRVGDEDLITSFTIEPEGSGYITVRGLQSRYIFNAVNDMYETLDNDTRTIAYLRFKMKIYGELPSGNEVESNEFTFDVKLQGYDDIYGQFGTAICNDEYNDDGKLLIDYEMGAVSSNNCYYGQDSNYIWGCYIVYEDSSE